MFESYLQIVLIDYPETVWVQCVTFREKIFKFRDFWSFLKKKNKKIEN